MDSSMKKLLLFLLLIPNLVMAELTPKPKGKPVITEVHQEPIKPMPYCDRFPYSDRCVSCTSDTILTSAKKIDGITFLIKTTETRLAKDHKFCYRYNNDSTKDVYEDQPRKKTEFMIMDLDNRMLEHKHVDDSAFAKPIKLIESSRDFPYTIISTQTFGVSNVNNTHYIYRTNPSFKKIAVLKAGEPNINFYKSNGAYLFEVVSLNPTGGPRSDWTYEVEAFALINDELISIDKRLIDERKERYDICANENFMTLDCYLSDKHKRSDRAIKPITKPIPKEIKPLPEGFAPIII
jgi:hypothetical protein